MNKNQKKVTATASGLAATAAIAFSMLGIMGGTEETLNYDIYVVSPYVSEIKIDEPKGESIDKIELYCNGEFVDNALLPNGTIQSIPLVFTDLENLEIKLYKRGKSAGTAKFDEDDKLIYRH